MPELIAPTARLHASWAESRDEWGHGVHQPGSGLLKTDTVDSPEDFAAWVDRLVAAEKQAAEGWVRCSYRWMVEGDRYLGAIALRHELTEMLLLSGGHIGYGVRPADRGRGVASWAVREMLIEARSIGLRQVLITCDDDNTGSARVIEGSGGVLEDVREAAGRPAVRRYWVGR